MNNEGEQNKRKTISNKQHYTINKKQKTIEHNNETRLTNKHNEQ